MAAVLIGPTKNKTKQTSPEENKLGPKLEVTHSV
jgi:hypothetical protein